MRNGVWFSLVALVVLANPALGQYSITVLHNNDGESRVINAGSGLEEYGGIARFATMVNDTRSFYQGLGHGVLTISSGDNFLAGAEFQASLNDGVFYDALAISRINYDAVILGNHEFDFGPGTLANFVSDAQSTNTTTFLSSNLDFSAESSLQTHVNNGLIAPSKVVNVSTGAGNKSIGIIGATTENLGFISSPGSVTVSNVAAAVNAQIADLQTQGVDHIILASHLQGIAEDQALVSQLNGGVDLIIAGGGDDRLASPGAASPGSVNAGAPASIVDTGFVPGDGAEGDYPTISSSTDMSGNTIPIVSTDANYKYLGRMTLNFDAAGNLTGAGPSSNPQRIASTTVDPTNGVNADATIQAETVDPVSTFVDNLANTVIGNTSQTIVGGGSSDLIRSAERNGGNLVADAVFAGADDAAALFGVDSPDIAFVNGGGIRADIAPGDVTLLDTYNVSRFQNFVSIVEDVSAADLKLLMENAYSKTVDGPGAGIDPMRQGDGTGRFAQLSGFSVVYNIFGQALELDQDGNVLTEGERIVSIMLDDGTMIVENGEVVFDGTLDIATLNFLLNGGDQYFDPDYLSQSYSFTTLGVTDQQALAAYIQSFGGADLASDFRYDSIADGRIVAIPEPSVLFCLGVLTAISTGRRRRK